MASEVIVANYQLPPPKAMICTGDVATNWKVFKEAYEDYAHAKDNNGEGVLADSVTVRVVGW